MKNTPNAPFSCKYTPQIPELLLNLNCSIAISTYQAGKLVLISPKDENSLVQLPRHFEKVMGIAEDKKKDKNISCFFLLILNSTTIHYCYLIDFSGNHSLYSYQFKSQD